MRKLCEIFPSGCVENGKERSLIGREEKRGEMGRRHNHHHQVMLLGVGGGGGGMEDEIRKGPWKAEEDEVLINHVNKYGPRDWSSIRSKGLLHRTGKSCRLRWVNKLRPNLKNGVKFSSEEERTVIELQAQFGNKWARIATYLPGRTDNDVKNFWSSRQKRLARLLQTPTPPPPPPPPPPAESLDNGEIAFLHDAPSDIEAPKLSSSMEEESSSKSQSCSSPLIDNSQMIKMGPLPDLVNPNLLNCDQNLLQLEHFNSADQSQQLPFPTIPEFQPNNVPLLLGTQEHSTTSFQDPNFLTMYGNSDTFDLYNITQLPLAPPCFGTRVGCQGGGGGGRGDNGSPATPDNFFNDFPADMFDQIEPFPSPSEW